MHLWCISVHREVRKGPMATGSGTWELPGDTFPSHSHAAGHKAYSSVWLSCAFPGKPFTCTISAFPHENKSWGFYPRLLQKWAIDHPPFHQVSGFQEDKRLPCNSRTVSPSVILRKKNYIILAHTLLFLSAFLPIFMETNVHWFILKT